MAIRMHDTACWDHCSVSLFSFVIVWFPFLPHTAANTTANTYYLRPYRALQGTRVSSRLLSSPLICLSSSSFSPFLSSSSPLPLPLTVWSPAAAAPSA
jgi:hypothetical protein